DLDAAWTNLMGLDAIKSRAAFDRLLSGGDATVTFVREKVRSAGVSPAQVLDLAMQLQDGEADDRNVAVDALVAMGPAVEPILHEALRNPRPEVAEAVREVLHGIDSRPLSDPAARATAAAVRLLQAMD